MNKGFLLYDLSENIELENVDSQFETRLTSFSHIKRQYENGMTHYGYVQDGFVKIKSKIGEYLLSKGQYFSVNSEFDLEATGSGFVASRKNYVGYFHVGGIIENTGRLKYIDGCTDSLLISPPREGDPCLNHLHFPPNIDQTMHTHPTVRLGTIARGSGCVVTPDGTIDLVEGKGWVIYSDSDHKFKTFSGVMDVIAYHPDSDFGPNDKFHPMINRTIVGGMSASYIDSIRTK